MFAVQRPSQKTSCEWPTPLLNMISFGEKSQRKPPFVSGCFNARWLQPVMCAHVTVSLDYVITDNVMHVVVRMSEKSRHGHLCAVKRFGVKDLISPALRNHRVCLQVGLCCEFPDTKTQTVKQTNIVSSERALHRRSISAVELYLP